MISDKFKLNFNFILNMSLFFLLILSSFVWADSNGVWHDAKDVRGGIFGNDEQDVSASLGFRFLNYVQFDENIFIKNDTKIEGRWFVTAHGVSPSEGFGMFGSYNLNINDGVGIIQAYDYDNNIAKNISLQAAGGNVGIGTVFPTSKLEVNGDIKAARVYSNGQRLVVEPPLCQGMYFGLQWNGISWNCTKVVRSVDCEGYWNNNSGSCSASCGPGKYDSQWITTVTPESGGLLCPSTQFVEDGGESCNLTPCIVGECGVSNGISFYSAPTQNLCNAGSVSSVVGTGPWMWQCTGNSDVPASCNANKIIDCVGSWSDTSTCSVTCGGGFREQRYTITTFAQNGGVACPYVNGATRWGTTSCNTQGCIFACPYENIEYLSDGTYTVPAGFYAITVVSIGGGGGGGGGDDSVNGQGGGSGGTGGNSCVLRNSNSQLLIRADGGSGGSGGGDPGYSGGAANGASGQTSTQVITVTPGEVLNIKVGGGGGGGSADYTYFTGFAGGNGQHTGASCQNAAVDGSYSFGSGGRGAVSSMGGGRGSDSGSDGNYRGCCATTTKASSGSGSAGTTDNIGGGEGGDGGKIIIRTATASELLAAGINDACHN